MRHAGCNPAALCSIRLRLSFPYVNDPAVIARRLIELRTEHRDLDVLIGRLTSDQTLDQLTVTRMKKRKLRLKDEIAWYESRLIPDLDA
jgi:hypothetical protein